MVIWCLFWDDFWFLDCVHDSFGVGLNGRMYDGWKMLSALCRRGGIEVYIIIIIIIVIIFFSIFFKSFFIRSSTQQFFSFTHTYITNIFFSMIFQRHQEMLFIINSDEWGFPPDIRNNDMWEKRKCMIVVFVWECCYLYITTYEGSLFPVYVALIYAYTHTCTTDHTLRGHYEYYTIKEAYKWGFLFHREDLKCT